MPGKQRSPNTWQGVGGLHPRAGGRSCAVNADGIASMDLFVVPTVSFRLLYGRSMMLSTSFKCSALPCGAATRRLRERGTAHGMHLRLLNSLLFNSLSRLVLGQ
jgi:hypothetical protein